jgi:hypothetical protein
MPAPQGCAQFPSNAQDDLSAGVARSAHAGVAVDVVVDRRRAQRSADANMGVLATVARGAVRDPRRAQVTVDTGCLICIGPNQNTARQGTLAFSTGVGSAGTSTPDARATGHVV